VRRPGRKRLALACLSAALASAALPAAAEEALRSVDLEALRDKMEITAPATISAGTLAIPIDGNVTATLPFSGEVVVLDVEASGPVMLTWASRTPGRQFRAFGPPWRHLTLPRARTRVRLDLRITDGWTPQARPVLGLTGMGTVTIHGIQVVPLPLTREELVADFNGAQRWAPESIGHTTINFLTPALWTASPIVWLTDVVALAALVAAAVALGLGWLRRRRLVAGPALVAGCLVATALWDVHLLSTMAPVFHLRPTLDVEDRIRDHYDVAPDVGALAALARATLRPDERVGALSSQGNWFAPQTICFNLAPRPCVTMTTGVADREHHGISGVGSLRDDQLDAIVAYRPGGALPPGFTPVASLGSNAVIARRRP
jgi:hypothetical protein